MNAAAKRIANDLGLNTPVVSYQGGLVVNGDEVLYERYLTTDQTERVLAWAKQENIHINLYNDDILYSETECYEVKRYCNNLHTEFTVKSFGEIEKSKINKLLAIDYNNPEKFNLLEKELPAIFPDLYIVKSTPYFLEFSNKEASKSCAVYFLREYWNLEKDEFLTIGDQNNDIELLKAGGIKIAMGNATEELKAVADYVTDSVYDNGLVTSMYKYCF